MNVISLVSLLLATVLYLINVAIYAFIIKGQKSEKLMQKQKFLSIIFTIYLLLCLGFEVVNTILYFTQGSANQLVSYLLSNAYCIWCIYSVIDTLSLPTKPKFEKHKGKMNALCFGISIADAAIFLGVALSMIHYVASNESNQLIIDIVYGAIVCTALVVLTTMLVLNVKQKQKLKTQLATIPQDEIPAQNN